MDNEYNELTPQQHKDIQQYIRALKMKHNNAVQSIEARNKDNQLMTHILSQINYYHSEGYILTEHEIPSNEEYNDEGKPSIIAKVGYTLLGLGILPLAAIAAITTLGSIVVIGGIVIVAGLILGGLLVGGSLMILIAEYLSE